FFVFNDLYPYHEPAPADIPDDRVLLRPRAQPFHQKGTSFGSILDAVALDKIKGRQGGGNADRVATKRGSMGTRHPIHNLGLGDDHAYRHARSDALRAANDVGVDARVFDRPP